MLGHSSLIVRASAAALALILGQAATAHAQCAGHFLPTAPAGHGPTVGFDDIVYSLLSKDGVLYVGGQFGSVDGVPASAIAVWNGDMWQTVLGGMYQGVVGAKPTVYTMAIRPTVGPFHASSLIVGGQFSDAGGPPGSLTSVPARNIASFADSISLFGWDPLATGLTGDARASVMHAGQLYVGGSFDSAHLSFARGLAHWTGTTWVAHTPPGFSPSAGDMVLALQPFGGKLVVAGGFNHFDLHYITALNGETNWEQMGSGMDGTVRALTVYNGELIAGGDFNLAGGLAVGGLARWNGTTWLPIGPGPLTKVYALAVYNSKLYAAGIDTLSNKAVLRAWDGFAWTTLFTGATNTWIDALTVHNGELILGGRFDNAATSSHNWARWSDLGKPWFVEHPASQVLGVGAAATFTAAPVFGYEAFGTVSFQWRRNGVPITDGPGGAAPGGGLVSNASGTLVPGAFAEMVISDLRPADQGSYDCVISTPCGSGASFPGTLTVMGGCPIDFNEDGIIDFADYLEFLTLFDAQDLRVDFDGDGVVDFADYLQFLNHFDTGC